MKKRVISVILTILILSESAYASVLGSVITSWSHEIADGTTFYNNTFLSEQDGVGKQAEYYAEYTPNKNVVPAVVNGQSLWGLKTIKQAEQYMKENDMVPLIGINASYFSWETGLPMGHVLSNGKIISKDTEIYQTIGFTGDGNAFIAPLAIETTLTSGETEIDIGHINKYNQPSMDIINLYTSDFDINTHTDSPALNIILGSVDGELAIGDNITAVVEEKFNYEGSIKIPDDKLVLTLNETGKPELYEALNSLEIGDEVVISNNSTSDSNLWETADSGLGSVGETLVKNGEVQSDFQTGAAPRTAVGITESGNIIFYVVDGRQKPYSYGLQLKTLAKRMKELGCIDAINLDGGGSTAISGIYPGTDESAVLNSPSGGTLRSCSNYIFLKNNQKPTDELGHLYLYPFEQHYLSGFSEEIFPAAADTAYYKMNIPDNLSYSVDGTESYFDKETGMLTANGTGKFTVSVTDGNITGSATYQTYESPTNIKVYNKETNKEIKSLSLKKDDRIGLSMTAQHYNIDLKSSDNCFELEVTNDLGYINENNELIITSSGGRGSLNIKAGDYVKEIPITVNFETVFEDITDHWAREMIKSVNEKGIISGYETDEGIFFRPDNNMTREEFSVIVCRFLGLNIDAYTDYDISEFYDNEKISDWAKPYVAAAFDSKLITGKKNGELIHFAPQDTLTRAEAMTILGRSLEPLDDEVTFTDSEDIPSWARKYISTMVSYGIVNGYEDNSIKPNGFVTRAEAVTIINKMPETIHEEGVL